MKTAYGFIEFENENEFKKWLREQKVTRTVNKLQVHMTGLPDYSCFYKSGGGHENILARQQSMKNYHVNTRGMSDIAQHFTIAPNGHIVTGRSLNKNPAGITGWNSNAICVEIYGNFDKGHDIMKQAQKDAVIMLYGELCKKFKLTPSNATIRPHAWFTSGGTYLGDYVAGKSRKTCPGTNFMGIGNSRAAFDNKFIPLIKAYINGQTVDNTPAQPTSDFVQDLGKCVITNYYTNDELGSGSNGCTGKPLTPNKSCASHNMPCGTKIYIEALKGVVNDDGIFIVEDTGGHCFDFDIFVSKDKSSKVGKQSLDVKVISWGNDKMTASYTYIIEYYLKLDAQDGKGRIDRYRDAWKKYNEMDGKLIKFFKFKDEDKTITSKPWYNQVGAFIKDPVKVEEPVVAPPVEPSKPAEKLTGKYIVRYLQTVLNSQYNAGLVVDGLYGPKTEAAIRTLKVGSRGDHVIWLQKALVNRGQKISVDGIFGNATKAAVIAYQKSRGLTADGLAGKGTHKAIIND